MGSVNLYIACIATGALCGLIISLLNSYMLQKKINSTITTYSENIFSASGENSLYTGGNIFHQIVSTEKTDAFKKDVLNHFDAFMQNKLPEAMPVLKMFIDEELIAELKKIFRTEMNQILPGLIEKNIASPLEKSSLLNQITAHIKAPLQKNLKDLLNAKIKMTIFKNIVISCMAGGVLGAAVAFLFQLF